VDGFFVALASAAGGFLPTPAKTVEQATDMIAIIAHVEPLPDQLGDPLRRPHLGREAVSHGSLREQAGQLRQFPPRKFGPGSRMLASGESPTSSTPVGAPPGPHGLPTDSGSAGHLGFGSALANPRDGLATANLESCKIPMGVVVGDHASWSHFNGRISIYLCRGL